MKSQDVLLKVRSERPDNPARARATGRARLRWLDGSKGKRRQRHVPVKRREEVLRPYQERYVSWAGCTSTKREERHPIELSYRGVKLARQGVG
jgi:hypothetical protein